MQIKNTLIFVLLMLSHVLCAQSVDPTVIKAVMTQKILNNIKWNKGDGSEYFHLGILAKNRNVVSVFKENLHGKTVNGKSVKVVPVDKKDDLSKFEAIFIGPAYSRELGNTIKIADSLSILLITDQAPVKQNVMINFYTENDKLKFEINRRNILQAGMEIDPDLVLLGGTELDVINLYKDTQQNLEKEKAHTERLEVELGQLKQEVEAKRREIEDQKQEIDRQKKNIEDQRKVLSKLNHDVGSRQRLLNKKETVLRAQEEKIAQQEQAIQMQETEIEAKATELERLSRQIDEKSVVLEKQKGLLNQQGTKIKSQKNIIYLFIALLVLGLALILIILRNNHNQKLFNRKLEEKNIEISRQKDVLKSQKEELTLANREITDSIKAAQVFQNAILPPVEVIKKYLPEFFVFYKPKDVVSGDFYWFKEMQGKTVLAVVDCTGHGVSGAFMSITGHHLLNESVSLDSQIEPAKILSRLNRKVIAELNDAESTSGMDISLCVLDQQEKKLTYAGANIPLYLLRNGKIIQYKADKFPIGFALQDKERLFINNEIDLEKGDIVYLFTDGYADQLGGPAGDEKFMYHRFREMLESVSTESMEDQGKILEANLTQWTGDNEQLDDVLVIGFRV